MELDCSTTNINSELGRRLLAQVAEHILPKIDFTCASCFAGAKQVHALVKGACFSVKKGLSKCLAAPLLFNFQLLRNYVSNFESAWLLFLQNIFFTKKTHFFLKKWSEKIFFVHITYREKILNSECRIQNY